MDSVLVVGGSVSGLFTAKFVLEKSNLNVCLVECKKNFGENITCAGGISSHMLKKAGLTIPDEFIASKVKTVHFYSPSFNVAELSFKNEYGLVLYRDRWEKALGEEVKNLGAKIHFGADGFTVLSLAWKKHPSLYSFIIGCDGISGATRRFLGLKPPPQDDIHISIQALCKSRKVSDDAINLFFGLSIAEKGYGWAFPVGGSEFRVGLGVPLSLSDRLVDSFNRLTSAIDAKILEKPRGKLIPTAKPMESLVFGNVLLVGDAGLQTDPCSGGGIGPAVIGAKCAAEAVVKGKHKLYDKLWKKHLYRRNKVRYALKQILYEVDDVEFEELINILKKFKPISEKIDIALLHLIANLTIKNLNFITKHKVLRKLSESLFLR